MYYHKDFLIRFIQQFIVFLARILKLKDKEEPDVILIEIEKAYSLFLGYPKDLLLKLDIPSIFHLFSVTRDYQYDRCAILGILLLEEADVYKKLKDEDFADILEHKGKEILKVCKNQIQDPLLKEVLLQHLDE